MYGYVCCVSVQLLDVCARPYLKSREVISRHFKRAILRARLAVFLVMVVSVGSGLYVGPGPSPLLPTYSESGSRELGGIRFVCDEEVGRATKVKNNTRSMRIFPEQNVTMTLQRSGG